MKRVTRLFFLFLPAALLAPLGAQIQYTISTIAGSGIAGFSGDNGPAVAALLNSPSRVATDSAGNVYVADPVNNRVRRVAAGTGIITTFAGNGGKGFAGDNGPAASASLDTPNGIALDSADNFYIADTGNNRIRKVTGGVITTIAGNGTAAFTGDGGPAAAASLNAPTGIAFDSGGNLYIADSTNNRIRRISTTGVITSPVGNGGRGFSGDGGAATAASLSSPVSVALDSAGNLYIADSGNNRIRKVINSVISTVAGNGTAASTGDGGPAAAASVRPTDIALDRAGNLYIADAGHRVRVVVADVISTIAGNGAQGFGGDNGPAAAAMLNAPGGVTVDVSGNVFIADSGNNRVRYMALQQAPNFNTALRIAQIVEGGPMEDHWRTLFAVTNLEAVPVSYSFRFWDDNGNPFAIALVGGAPGVLAGVVAPGATVFAETPGTSAVLRQGWAEVSSTGRLGVVAIFRRTQQGQAPTEGAVTGLPSGRNIILPFDNTPDPDALPRQFQTGVAIANTSANAVNVVVLFRSDSGAQAQSSLFLPARSHTAFVVPVMFPAVAGLRGSLQMMASSPDITVLGLRFNASGGFTSLTPFEAP